MTEPKPVAFTRFGGLRLDQAIDEVGPENAIYLRDVDWDGSVGRLRPRDGFAKLKAADATGPYKGLFPHSATRLLATKRVSSESLKLVAIDREGVEKKEATLNKAAVRSIFAHFGTPTTAYTYMRTLTGEQKVVRFDGENFTEPTATLNKNPDGTGGTPGKAMPKGACMIVWPAGGYRLVVANTAAKGGPGEAASSDSHVWFSDSGDAESWHTDVETQAGEANYVQLSPGDGEEITDICVWGGLLFVFKETKFFRFFGVSEDGEGRPEFNFTEISLGEGSRMKRPTIEALAETSDRLACAAPDALYFCTSDGVWATTGGPPAKVSGALRPLEEVSPFDGPMADLLNGSSEVFRWPASGIVSLGQRIVVKRYEFMFVYDVPTGQWTCWKMPAVSLAVWPGLPSASAASVVLGPPKTATGAGAVVPWANPSNITADDENYASAAFGFAAASAFLKASNFGFTFPAGATIVGVKVDIKRKKSGAGVITDHLVQLLKGLAPVGENLAKTGQPWGGALTQATYGGGTQLWGLGPSKTELESSEFGVMLSAESDSAGGVAEVGYVTVTVYFTLTEASPGMRPRLLCTQSKSIFATQPGASEDAATRQAEWQSGFYDLGSEDEKTLEGARIWGAGEIAIDGYLDLAETPAAQSSVSIDGRNQARVNDFDQTGFLFSHRLKLSPGSSVQRVVRYLRETELAGGEGAP